MGADEIIRGSTEKKKRAEGPGKNLRENPQLQVRTWMMIQQRRTKRISRAVMRKSKNLWRRVYPGNEEWGGAGKLLDLIN